MKNKKTLIIILASFAILLLAYFVWDRETENKFNWSENYRTESKEPYGTIVIKELLKSYHKNKKFELIKGPISKSLFLKSDSIASNYVFVGNRFDIDSVEIDSLISFVEAGNNAFICSKSIPDELMDKLYNSECGEWKGYFGHDDTIASMNFYDDSLKSKKGCPFVYKFKNKTYDHDWLCFDGRYFCDTVRPFYEIGYIDSFYVNYVQIPYGDGNFLFHTSPMAFTNSQLLTQERLEYAGKVFSYLNDGNIYWDEYNKMEDSYSKEYNGFSESPLRFIISQPALRWAWYLTLALVLLYVLFHAKRKQPVIPMMEANVNTSLEFVKTIGRLYFQQTDHKKIGRHKMKLFLNFIRNRYYLQINNPDETLMRKICEKSELPYEHIEKIFRGFELVNYTIVELSENDLVEFHQSIDYFYKHCK